MNSKERRKQHRELWLAWAVRAKLAGCTSIPPKYKGLGALINHVRRYEKDREALDRLLK